MLSDAATPFLRSKNRKVIVSLAPLQPVLLSIWEP